MDIAIMLHHGVRKDALNEVTSFPHMELIASNTMERQRLQVLVNQLTTFGSIPFAYKEMDSIDMTRQGAILRIALCERSATNESAH